MHDGIDDEGKNLYPAFPYPWFRLISREDDDAILAFLKTTPAVNYTPPKNELPFPLNIRSMVKGWNLLYLNSHDFQAESEPIGRMESRRLSRQRPRPLRRLPHAQERAWRRQSQLRRSTAARSTTGWRRT